jgi:hypothetical protein
MLNKLDYTLCINNIFLKLNARIKTDHTLAIEFRETVILAFVFLHIK